MKEYWVNVRCTATYQIKVCAELKDNAAANAIDLLDKEGARYGDFIPYPPEFYRNYRAEVDVLDDENSDFEEAQEDE